MFFPIRKYLIKNGFTKKIYDKEYLINNCYKLSLKKI